MNLDGHALPIKKLKGTEPVESLDLSNKLLGVASAIVIASLIGVNGALTSVDLRGNQLRDEGWGAIFAAICGNKDSKIIAMNASSENISPAGVKLIAEALRTSVAGALMVTNLQGNNLDAESAKMLAEGAKRKGIPLCGIQRDQTTADFSNQNLKLPDAILLASDLSQAVVTGGLTSIDLRGNQLCGIWNDGSGTQRGTYTAEGIIAIANALRVHGALTSVDLRGNLLGDEGCGAIFAAICGNKDSKIMSLDASSENIGPAGVKLIAEALRTSVTGALTSVDLSGNLLTNHGRDMTGIKELAAALGVNGGLTALKLSFNSLKDEGVGAICEAIKSNKETRLASLNFENNGIGPVGANSMAAMVAVTGGLTELSIFWNNVRDEGVDAICEAIKSNKETKLASLNFGNNIIGPVGANTVATMVAVTGSLTQVLTLRPPSAFPVTLTLTNVFNVLNVYRSWTSQATGCAGSIVVGAELTLQRGSQRLPTLCASIAG